MEEKGLHPDTCGLGEGCRQTSFFSSSPSLLASSTQSSRCDGPWPPPHPSLGQLSCEHQQQLRPTYLQSHLCSRLEPLSGSEPGVCRRLAPGACNRLSENNPCSVEDGPPPDLLLQSLLFSFCLTCWDPRHPLWARSPALQPVELRLQGLPRPPPGLRPRPLCSWPPGWVLLPLTHHMEPPYSSHSNVSPASDLWACCPHTSSHWAQTDSPKQGFWSESGLTLLNPFSINRP